MYPEKLHGPQKERISTEMYLKTIYQIEEKRGRVKPIDIVGELDVSKSSVSEMLRKLQEEGYITYESYGTIELQEAGKKLARNVLNKYEVICDFLKDVLGLSDNEAIHDEACNLEHAFSDSSITKLAALVESKKSKV